MSDHKQEQKKRSILYVEITVLSFTVIYGMIQLVKILLTTK